MPPLTVTQSMPKTVPYYIVLDTNIWVSERLLQSSIGAALLYAVAGAKGKIGLPEVVEREISRVLPDMAEKAVNIIRREAALLRQLSGHSMMVTGPTRLAVLEGIAERWKQLAGVIERSAFTFDQAQSALTRIIDKLPPCGDNNEQFRDCCIWDAAVSSAGGRIVNLVTADVAFYEGRKLDNGLARPLREELDAKGVDLRIYPTLRDLLNALKETAATIDETAIATAIVETVTPRAREVALESGNFELVASGKPSIFGYATPTPALVAISFVVPFEIERVETEGDAENTIRAKMTLSGECAYDPNRNAVSGVEIQGWSQSLKTPGGGFSGTRSAPTSVELRQYSPGYMRRIT
jgi:hypothetical protein